MWGLQGTVFSICGNPYRLPIVGYVKSRLVVELQATAQQQAGWPLGGWLKRFIKITDFKLFWVKPWPKRGFLAKFQPFFWSKEILCLGGQAHQRRIFTSVFVSVIRNRIMCSQISNFRLCTLYIRSKSLGHEKEKPSVFIVTIYSRWS